MPDLLASHVINPENLKFIKYNVARSGIITSLRSYDVELLSYIPFLSNSSNLDIINLDNSNTFTPEKLVSNNGYIEYLGEEDPDEEIRNINGRLHFLNNNTNKDLYYLTDYTSKTATVTNVVTLTEESMSYMEEEIWHNFMFYFSTNDVSPRVIAVFNSSIIVSLNNSGRIAVSIDLLDVEYNELYNLSLQSQGAIKPNREVHIAIYRDKYAGKYRYSLFINGSESDSQISELEYYELKAEDVSAVIDPSNPKKTLFWFHEAPNIQTNLDDIYTFTMTEYTNIFPKPPKIQILTLPIDKTITNYTVGFFNVSTKRINKTERTIGFSGNGDFDTCRYIVSQHKQFTTRLLSKNKKFITPIYKNTVVNTKNINYTNLQCTHVFKHLTCVNILRNFDIKFDTNIQSLLMNKTLSKRIINNTSIIYNDTKLNALINIKHKQQGLKLLNGTVTETDLVIRYLAKKESFTIENICRYVVLGTGSGNTGDSGGIENTRNGYPATVDTIRDVKHQYNIFQDTKRFIQQKMTVRHSTKRTNSDLDDYRFDLSRCTAKNKEIKFNKGIVVRDIAIPFKSRIKLCRNVTISLFENSVLLKPINIYRNISKTTKIHTYTQLTTYPKKRLIGNITRLVGNKVRWKSQLTRNVKCLKNRAWAFVVDTNYYT